MKFLSLIVNFVIIFCYLRLIDGAKFDIYAKSMKIWYDKSWGYIPNPSQCRIRTTREIPTGYVSCEGYLLKRVDYVYSDIKLYYKYGTIYRPYLIQFTKTQPCELMKKKRSVRYSNPLDDLILKGVKYCCPQFNHECPYYPGWYNSSFIDINATISPLLPPVVPAGQYKIWGRSYLEDNVTIAEGEGVGVVKPRRDFRDTDFSMLNMG